MHYALREYRNPTVHSPSTVKNYLLQPQTILQKKIFRVYSLLSFYCIFTAHDWIIFFFFNFLRVINMSHFDPIDPNVLMISVVQERIVQLCWPVGRTGRATWLLIYDLYGSGADCSTVQTGRTDWTDNMVINIWFLWFRSGLSNCADRSDGLDWQQGY
jgi:hypothetical protein